MKLIQTLQLLFALVISISINAQTAKGIVTYKVTRQIDKESKTTKMLETYYGSEFIKSTETIADEFEFKLIFNTESAIFYMKDKLYSDKHAANFAKNMIGHFGRIEQQKTYFITENLEEDFGKFLVKRPYQNWTLHEETKMIDNYLCFKATTFYTVTNPKGKVFIHNFTAWYAPQLPYKYGPIGYGNLPGLIMELQAKGFTYGVSKIEFVKDDDKSFKMPKLKNKKLITGEELERLAAIDEEKRRRN
ncbi:MAG: GLPGLI family protein [Flavobacteriaceae bacterium]|nr:GLPGLI family protein [Flavobacteriaceae bacterium]